MVVEAAPPAPFIITKAEFLLEFLVKLKYRTLAIL
jgi:hypothetical protein